MTTTDTAAHMQPFQAEVSELLHLMVHSVYSETDIFLRELISNASDACDKLRYEAIADPSLMGDGAAPKIRITPNKKDSTLKIADNGIGMAFGPWAGRRIFDVNNSYAWLYLGASAIALAAALVALAFTPATGDATAAAGVTPLAFLLPARGEREKGSWRPITSS